LTRASTRSPSLDVIDDDDDLVVTCSPSPPPYPESRLTLRLYGTNIGATGIVNHNDDFKLEFAIHWRVMIPHMSNNITFHSCNALGLVKIVVGFKMN
jgi:hypothetical protein